MAKAIGLPAWVRATSYRWVWGACCWSCCSLKFQTVPTTGCCCCCSCCFSQELVVINLALGAATKIARALRTMQKTMQQNTTNTWRFPKFLRQGSLVPFLWVASLTTVRCPPLRALADRRAGCSGVAGQPIQRGEREGAVGYDEGGLARVVGQGVCGDVALFSQTPRHACCVCFRSNRHCPPCSEVYLIHRTCTLLYIHSRAYLCALREVLVQLSLACVCADASLPFSSPS